MAGAKKPKWCLGAIIVLLLILPAAMSPAIAQTIATYHGRPDRSGNFTMPTFTWEQARTLRLNQNFAPRFTGNLYAQPLHWMPAGKAAGILIVASESNNVVAINAADGSTLWQRNLGLPAARSAFACGNIDPLGITATPVIDEASA